MLSYANRLLAVALYLTYRHEGDIISQLWFPKCLNNFFKLNKPSDCQQKAWSHRTKKTLAHEKLTFLEMHGFPMKATFKIDLWIIEKQKKNMSRGEVVQKNHEVLQKPQSYICPIFLFCVCCRWRSYGTRHLWCQTNLWLLLKSFRWAPIVPWTCMGFDMTQGFIIQLVLPGFDLSHMTG